MSRTRAAVIAAWILAAAALVAQPSGPGKLDAEGERWVSATLKKMTLDDKVGQLIVSSFGAEFMSTDSP